MRVRALTTAAWTGIAVLVGHLAAYRITYADPHERAHALAASGHGWAGHLPALLATMVLGAALGTLVETIAERRNGNGKPRRRVHELLALAGGGTATYVLVETGERLLHHGNLANALHDLANGGHVPLLVGVLFIVTTAPLFLIARRGLEALAGDAAPLPRTEILVAHCFVDAIRVHGLLPGIEPTRGPPTTRLGRTRTTA